MAEKYATMYLRQMNLLRVLLCSVCGQHPSDVPPKSKIPVQIEKSENGRRSGAFYTSSSKTVVLVRLFGVRQRPPQGAEFVCIPCGANDSKSSAARRAGSSPATGTTASERSPLRSNSGSSKRVAGFFVCAPLLLLFNCGPLRWARSLSVSFLRSLRLLGSMIEP